MPQGHFNYFIIVIVIVLGVMIFMQTRNAKKQQRTMQEFRETLEPGTEVITIGGIIGKVVSVDAKYEEIVIDSEGSLLRFTSRAVNKAYVRPAFIDDEPEDDDNMSSENNSYNENESSESTVESTSEDSSSVDHSSTPFE